MKKRNEFQPQFGDHKLEDRVLLSQARTLLARRPIVLARAAQDTPAIKVDAVSTQRVARPIAANAHVTRPALALHRAHRALPTLTAKTAGQVHQAVQHALVSYATDVTNGLATLQGAIERGEISGDSQTIFAYLNGFNGTGILSTANRKLDYQVLNASTRVPYGAGFNTYSTGNPADPLAPLPSGGQSLYTRLNSYIYTDAEFNEFVAGPLAQYRENFYNAFYTFNDQTFEQGYNFDAGIAALGGQNFADASAGIGNTIRQYIHDGVANRDFRYKA